MNNFDLNCYDEMLSYHVTHLVHVKINPCTVVTAAIKNKLSLYLRSHYFFTKTLHKSRYFCNIKVSYTTSQFHLFLGHDIFSKPYGAQHFQYFGP